MTAKYYPPVFAGQKFHCIRCGVYAKQAWSGLKADGTRYDESGDFPINIFNNASSFVEELPNDFVASECSHCDDFTLWQKRKIIFPRSTAVELPNEDLTDEIKELYNEAALILNDSPRAAAALLRLALQLLIKELGGRGKHIDTDIKTIVSYGVDPQVQKAMDIVRVFGNNGTHPGEIQLNEDPDLVKKMFELINFIATKMISSKKEIDNLFESLPDGAKEAIEKRDNIGDTEKLDD